MTTYTWSTVSGSWNSSNWTPSGYPNALTDQADITSAGTYTVTVATGQTYQLDALVLDDANATLQVDGTLNFTGTDKTFALQAGTLQLNGVIEGATIEASGGVLSLSSGTFQGVTYQGELDIPDSQTLTTLTTLGGLVVEKAGGAAGGTIALGTGANLDVTGGLTVGTVSSIGSIELTGDVSSIAFNDAETLNYASVTVSGYGIHIYGNGSMLTFGAATTVTLSGDNDWLSGTFTNLGSIDVTGGLTTASGGTFDNQGSLSVTGGGDLFVAQTIFSNEGQISVVGGYMDVESTTFTSTDALLLDGGGRLEIEPATAAAVTYVGPSTLVLDYPTTYTGTLSGLGPGDMLQLNGETVTSASIVGTTLTVVLQSGGPLTYTTGTGLSGTKFSISTGSDGYQDLLTVVCFLAGTRILTEHGEVRVEDLRVGDRVVTRGADGAALEPVRWIGRRRIDTGTHPRPSECRPIRIRRDAIAPGRPHRDLLVSPDHAVFLDGMLIPAKLLVNGMTIVQDNGIRHVKYFHVELDRHAILVSEGLETESYLDTGNRPIFENAGLAMTLHPAFSVETRIRNWNDHACAPLAVARSAVEPIWRRLATRAAELGHISPPPPKTTTDPDLRLAVCGRMLRPIDLADGRYIFALPRGADSAVLRSRAAAPADFEPFDQDRRRLGVALRRLRLHLRGAERLCEIAVDAPVLTKGWWAAEGTADVLWRWTDGAALIPLPAGATMLEVELHGVHRYPEGPVEPLEAAAA